jgi:hypothetical protein
MKRLGHAMIAVVMMLTLAAPADAAEVKQQLS